MELRGYIACICEGAAERAIIDILLENNKLIFNIEVLLDGEVLKCRNAGEFERKYLRKNFSKDITVIRILDSRSENFKLSKAYQGKISIINVITAPEIEMLIIISKGKYKEYKKLYVKNSIKPSDYCKVNLKMQDVKKYDYVKEYFCDANELLRCIKEYKRLSRIKRGEYTLADLLK